MGFVVLITMVSLGHGGGAMVGFVGAFCGSIISTRLMQRSCLKTWPEMDSPAVEDAPEGIEDKADAVALPL